MVIIIVIIDIVTLMIVLSISVTANAIAVAIIPLYIKLYIYMYICKVYVKQPHTTFFRNDVVFRSKRCSMGGRVCCQTFHAVGSATKCSFCLQIGCARRGATWGGGARRGAGYPKWFPL